MTITQPTTKPNQPSLFEELPEAPSKSFRATVVRRVPGEEPSTGTTATPALTTPAPALTTPASAPHNGTKTSRAAAEQVPSATRVSQSDRIFHALLSSMSTSPMGMTRELLAAATGIEESTVCARVRPMVTGQDSRYQVVEPGLTRIGAEGARQKVLWVGIEKQDPHTLQCPECSGKAVSRLFEVASRSMDDSRTPVYAGYLTVRSCTCSGCWWSQIV